MLLFLGGLWMMALISWRLLGTIEMCMPRVLNKTPRKMASDLQMWRHNLAHFCCAKICHSKYRLFLISPSPGICSCHIHNSVRNSGIQHTTERVGASGGLYECSMVRR